VHTGRGQYSTGRDPRGVAGLDLGLPRDMWRSKGLGAALRPQHEISTCSGLGSCRCWSSVK